MDPFFFQSPLQRQRYLDFDQSMIDMFKGPMGFIETELPNILDITSSFNDGLNGENPVIFTTKDDKRYQIIHSQAKLKRQYMSKYAEFFTGFDCDQLPVDDMRIVKTQLDQFTTQVTFPSGPIPMPLQYQGMVSKMNAIRAQEIPDATHSYSVRQYEFCVKVTPDQTSDQKLETLKSYLTIMVPHLLSLAMPEEKSFQIIHSDRFFAEHDCEGFKSAAEFETARSTFEQALGKQSKCFVIVAIGKKHQCGYRYDDRSADYDDWQANCDIFMHNGTKTIEICSMGFRVDGPTLQRQMAEHGKEPHSEYHEAIMGKEYTQTLGGGVGLDRLRMVKFQLDSIDKSNPNL